MPKDAVERYYRRIGADAVVGNGWSDEGRARRLFDDLVTRYAELAERMW